MAAIFITTATLIGISSKCSPHRSKKSFPVLCSTRPKYIPSHISDPNYVRILDTTLRDGEQSPGVAMTRKEKLDIARLLAKLGVDIIEAGFPATSESEVETIKLIAQEVGNMTTEDSGHAPVICGMSRCTKYDIDKVWEAVRYAKYPRIRTFIATSEIHMKYKLNMTRDEVVERARNMVTYARSLGCNDVAFGAEDASRSERDLLYEIFSEAIKAGATSIDVTDTVGNNLPREYGQLISDIRANTPGIENVILAAHCHNDLGLATANTLEGACSGARILEVSINGIGERAGNASLEEVVMAIKSKGKLLGGLSTGINSRHITEASKMVEEYSGLKIQAHKAIVGANAFSHQSGIHQDGMLKNISTYQFLSPEDIGLDQSNKTGVTLGKLSGRHAFKAKLIEVITDDDIIALVSN